MSETIRTHQIAVGAVLSGNRNFEGRVHPLTQLNWLASPPLVVAYGLVGTTRIDLSTQPLGHDTTGQPVYLHDIWPSQSEIDTAIANIQGQWFQEEYQHVFDGDHNWQEIDVTTSQTYPWSEDSSYVKQPPFFQDLALTPEPMADIEGARILAILGDSVTTDHISPAGVIAPDSPAGRYLQDQGITPEHFNSYGAGVAIMK